MIRGFMAQITIGLGIMTRGMVLGITTMDGAMQDSGQDLGHHGVKISIGEVVLKWLDDLSVVLMPWVS